MKNKIPLFIIVISFAAFLLINSNNIQIVVAQQTSDDENFESDEEFGRTVEKTGNNTTTKIIIKEDKPAPTGPKVKDSSLKVEKYVDGLNWPTTMGFVGNDILVLEKNSGLVRLIKNGELMDEPVLQVNVGILSEQGLLGIVTKDPYVYLYYTEKNPDTGDILGNRIYKYLWSENKLTEPILLKDLPTSTSGMHNGGAMVIDLNGTVFAVIGDAEKRGVLQNQPGEVIADTSVIFPVDPPGPYYAIGIRNSFGLAVDPLTGNIWDTENGPTISDEINFVLPKSNSGWVTNMGLATSEQILSPPPYEEYQYSNPEFTWEVPVAPTGISFVVSDLFEAYENSILVTDFNRGFIYKFNLNEDRTGFVFQDPSLSDLVVNSGHHMEEIVFGKNFGGMTDIEIGPDGLIYIVSLIDGAIYRIIPVGYVLNLDDDLLPPLKQMYSGVLPIEVTCKSDLELVFKKSNDSPACVSPDAVERLKERGWAK